MPKVQQRDILVKPKKKSLENDAVASVLLQGMAGKCSHKEIAKVAGVSLTAVKEFNRKQSKGERYQQKFVIRICNSSFFYFSIYKLCSFFFT